MTDIEQEEIWRTYPDYDFIEVSNLGRVRTKDRKVTRSNGSKYFVKGRVLKLHLLPNGYMQAHLSMNGEDLILLVHRAVAICFIPNPNNYLEVNHIDNDRANNVESNLEWCSRKYNEAYKKNFGTSQAEVLGRPVIAVNRDTSEVFWFESQREAGRQLGVNSRSISDVVNGKHKTTHGFWFCNADENAIENTRNNFGDDIARKVEKLIGENYD